MWKYILLALAFVILTVVAGLISILNWPGLILNRTVLGKAAAYTEKIGLDVKWDKLDISYSSLGFLDKKISISFGGLCIEKKPLLESLCFEKADLAFRYSFREVMPRLLEVGPVDLNGGRLSLVISQASKKNERDSFPVPKISLPTWISSAKFFPISVEVGEIGIKQKDSAISGKASFKIETTQAAELERGDLTAELRDLRSDTILRANVALASPSHFLNDDWQMNGNIEAELKAGARARLDVQAQKEADGMLNNQLKGTFTQKDISVGLSANGTIAAKSLSEELNGNVILTGYPIKNVNVTGCKIELAATNSGFNRGNLQLNCPISADLKFKRLPRSFQKIYETPERITFNLSISAETFLFPDLSQTTKGSLRAEMTPANSNIMTTSGYVAANFSGILANPPKEWKVSSNADLKLEIQKFAKLKDILKGSDFEIPAPLNSLEGTVSLSVKGSVPSLTEASNFPISFETKLSSEKENFDIDINGNVSVMKGAEIKMDVELTDIKIELPDLKPPSFPRVYPDERITKEAINPQKKTKIHYDIGISTPKSQPVRFISKSLKAPVPIDVDMRIKNDDITGNIIVNSVPLNLFHRDATLESFEIKFGEPLNQSEIKGQVKVAYVDYTISINLVGTVERPSVYFESEPPMSQDNIIATLIYGEPFDNLNAGDASSVGNMSSAIADRAIALTSLFVLASTPIQRVNYDPKTGAFSAKLKLGKRTSLNAGTTSSTSSEQVGLQRSLGKGWVINTNVQTPSSGNNTTAPNGTNATALIEWHKRY